MSGRKFKRKFPFRKFRARRTNGYASKSEYARSVELKELEDQGVIDGLEEQVPFEIQPDGCERIRYIADFTYYEKGEYIVEDVKGVQTDVFRLKAKLFKGRYPQYKFCISKAKYKEGKIIGFSRMEYGTPVARRSRPSRKAGKRHTRRNDPVVRAP